MAFDERKAQRVIRFIEALKHTKGEFHGKPFELLPWQEKIIREVFGTVRDDDPTQRQYTSAYIEIPKKNGKSELGAAIALNMLVNDDEWKAEVYSCASDRQQAAIVFDVAVDMVKQSPALMKRIKIVPSMKRMVYQPTGSIYQVLSSEVATKHGLNVSACIFDELHTQPTRALYDVMTQGSGDARKQPLWFSSRRRAPTATASAWRCTRRPSTFSKDGRMILASIPCCSDCRTKRTGRTSETGIAPIRRWITRSPSTRCATPTTRHWKRLRTKTCFASSA